MKIPRLGILAIACAAACQGAPPVPGIKAPPGVDNAPSLSAEDEAKADALAKRAADAASTDPAQATAALDELLAKYPGSRAGAAELSKRAEAARHDGHHAEAIGWF